MLWSCASEAEAAAALEVLARYRLRGHLTGQEGRQVLMPGYRRVWLPPRWSVTATPASPCQEQAILAELARLRKPASR